MRDLPLPVLKGVDVGVAGLDLVTGCTHGKLINASIHTPVIALDYVTLENDALGLLLKEIGEVCLDSGVVRTRFVTYRGKEN